jgi:ribosome production factor 1
MEGRQVVTFHNQRDFIFVRHHRYVYKQEEGGKVRARLQELGPRRDADTYPTLMAKC